MRGADRTFDRILKAFAEAVAAGELEKAEGWLAVARWAQGAREIASYAPVR
jgi:hypothetical protein